MKTKTYTVRGWINGANYDADKPADYVVTVRAESALKAEEAGDRKLTRLHEKCEVILADEPAETI